MVAFQTHHPRIGAYPQPSAVVLVQGPHDAVRQARRSFEPGERVVPVAYQAAARADPEGARPVLVEGLHVRVLEGRGILLVEDHEAHAVEADEALLGAEPEVTVARLDDGANRVLRKALLGRPDAVPVLRRGEPGVEGKDRRRPGAEQAADDRNRARATSHDRITADHSTGRRVPGTGVRAGTKSFGGGSRRPRTPRRQARVYRSINWPSSIVGATSAPAVATWSSPVSVTCQLRAAPEVPANWMLRLVGLVRVTCTPCAC